MPGTGAAETSPPRVRGLLPPPHTPNTPSRTGWEDKRLPLPFLSQPPQRESSAPFVLQINTNQGCLPARWLNYQLPSQRAHGQPGSRNRVHLAKWGHPPSHPSPQHTASALPEDSRPSPGQLGTFPCSLPTPTPHPPQPHGPMAGLPRPEGPRALPSC